MPEPVLPAPWRMDYIRSLERSPAERSTSGCFLCDAVAALDDAEQRRERLVLWSSERCICLLNRYPYTSGHLLIAPRKHLADLDVLDAETLVDLNVQVVRAVTLLKKVMRPQGFNLGINMGSAAGAGVPGHLHEHVVPRWAGDVNFISVVGETKVVPSTVSALWAELMGAVESTSSDRHSCLSHRRRASGSFSVKESASPRRSNRQECLSYEDLIRAFTASITPSSP